MRVTQEPPKPRKQSSPHRRKPPEKQEPPQEPPHVGIGRRLALLRELAGYEKQADLADDAGIDRSTYNRAECGRQRLRQKSYDKIIRTLQKRVRFTVVWFLHGEGEGPNSEGLTAVEDYLTSELGRDASAEVQAELRNINWSALSAAHRTRKAINRLREAIESNLRLP